MFFRLDSASSHPSQWRSEVRCLVFDLWWNLMPAGSYVSRRLLFSALVHQHCRIFRNGANVRSSHTGKCTPVYFYDFIWHNNNPIFTLYLTKPPIIARPLNSPCAAKFVIINVTLCSQMNTKITQSLPIPSSHRHHHRSKINIAHLIVGISFTSN